MLLFPDSGLGWLFGWQYPMSKSTWRWYGYRGRTWFIGVITREEKQ